MINQDFSCSIKISHDPTKLIMIPHHNNNSQQYEHPNRKSQESIPF